METTPALDPIDAAVDDLLRDPGRADRLRARLDQFQDKAKPVGETPERARARLRLLAICSDAEGLWDEAPG
ncbi:MAG: hypothetical protein H6895_11705 [Defluviimonas sp.]|uniref:hypothetical protein n=1 Tax=Albidovulum sp. TaxID=1872424 RepID=UPI001D63DAAF|nr:hypothetical protein [Paracoccaceae bacterium]MCC0064734.1 hypothetical protein [Defluviimonas sp.]